MTTEPQAGSPGHPLVELDSTAFATRATPYAAEVGTASDGDLWPTTWADDDALYTANGDGRGFSADAPWADIVVNRVDGTPETSLTGVRLAAGDELGPVLTDPSRYNRKPTGIVAVDGDRDGRDELYLAVQDLRKPAAEGQPPHPAFDDAPAATIVRSLDRGRTWQWPTEPMFRDYVFTTIFFLDFGRSNERASVLGPDGADYVYAYGLDHNWRDSCSDVVPDPVDLWLARVPIEAIQQRDRWEFFAGTVGEDPVWSGELDRRVPVLHDERRVYPGTVTADGMSVLSQGGVVYNQGLDRYLYFSWTEFSWEFYEAPRPWGPWKLFLHKEFGPYPWWGSDPGTPGPKNGGYGTVAPSKFISNDGRTLWLQANWFNGVDHPPNTYHFSLRRLELTPYADSTPDNPADPTANLARAAGTVVIDRVSRHGRPEVINDGSTEAEEDSRDDSRKDTDLWGYEWPRAHRFDRVVYTTGTISTDGGWFAGPPRLQVRQRGAWRDITPTMIEPDYPADPSVRPRTAYTFRFAAAWGDGLRLIGRPGGPAAFTSIAELEVYYDG
ncbi:hypothetical protein [Microlunatus speluncae]|uniref:hypothetical protein n=1 Tax=Microlunatus speluncae TaxID=2594267 RepID=UPI0012663006|nr:hypothetical protein [Microlunatus speluncae]